MYIGIRLLIIVCLHTNGGYSLARILLIAMGSAPVLSHSSREALAFSFVSSMTKEYSPTEYRNTRCKRIQYLIQWVGGTAKLYRLTNPSQYLCIAT